MSIHFFPAGQIPPSGSANVGDVRSGKTFTSGSGSNLTGTLAEAAGGNTITPGTASQQAIAGGTIANAAITVAGDANLVAGNIVSPVSIFGVAGTAQPRKYATGTATSDNTVVNYRTTDNVVRSQYSVTVSGLNFQANVIVVRMSSLTNGNLVEQSVVYSANKGFSSMSPGSPILELFASTSVNATVYPMELSDSASVTATGFKLPFPNTGIAVTWEAWN